MKTSTVIFIISVVIIILVIYLYKKKTNRKYKHKTYQHNKDVIITDENYEFVKNYKKNLIQNITNVLNDNSVHFSIANGNLLEYERNEPIYHDDDIDVRFTDFDNWFDYCQSLGSVIDTKNNLVFDDRILDKKKQLFNGVQVRLIEPKLPENLDIHLDLIYWDASDPFWKKFIVNFDNLRPITYLDVNTFAPSKEDTVKNLTMEYGKDYLIPD